MLGGRYGVLMVVGNGWWGDWMVGSGGDFENSLGG